MKKSTIFLAILVTITVIGMLAWKFIKPALDKKAQQKTSQETSEAKDIKGEVSIALDSWAGYFPFWSKDFKKKMRQAGYTVKIIDDKADYPERMKQLAEGKINFAVVTVDSFLLNAAQHSFPGVIIFVIDESHGGDAIVARKSIGENLQTFRGKSPHVAFTPHSPSHHLLKAVKAHFGLGELLPPKGSPKRIETEGSEGAYKLLKNGQAEVAVLWEPDVSRATADSNFVKIFSTAETRNYIVDILVVNRKFLAENKALVKLLVATYFRTLKYYTDHPQEMADEFKEAAGLAPEMVQKMIKGVSWQNLTANATDWFGIGQPGENAQENIVYAIESTVKVLIDSGDFSSNPLPNEDPYQLYYADILEDLYLGGMGNFGKGTQTSAMITKFDSLPPERWEQLKVIGNLKVNPIVFQSGTSILTFDGKLELDELINKLRHFPQYRIKVIGHTSNIGDPELNKAVSLERAQAVVKYLTETHGVDPNRCLAKGLGGEEPLPQMENETEKQWHLRLRRVEIILLKEEI